VWSSGFGYEGYVGRWSRAVAREFLDWLAVPAGSRWLDVGCGTGALTGTVLDRCTPSAVVGVDPSTAFLRYAAAEEPEATFLAGSADALPVAAAAFDAVVSGLALNFVPDRKAAIGELRRAARPGGLVAAYVWDYAGGMQLMSRFWDAAAHVDPDAAALREDTLFDFCRPGPLREMFEDGGLREVAVEAIVVPTIFADFDDYWSPFLHGQGPAPSYAASLRPDASSALREALRERLPTRSDGSIHLTARAWAVKGENP
jgi:ubiquinone/menaquinone biosynthesis C-methylase UbiE